MKARSCFPNFSATFEVAELLLETTATDWPFKTAFAMIFKIVCVFPVPGGPCIMLIWEEKAFSTAAFWLWFSPNGKISSLLPLRSSGNFLEKYLLRTVSSLIPLILSYWRLKRFCPCSMTIPTASAISLKYSNRDRELPSARQFRVSVTSFFV